MRSVLRVGAIATAATSLLLSGAVAAQAAPAAPGVTVSVAPLIFEPAQTRYTGHTGRLRFTIHNGTDRPYLDGVQLTEPIAHSFYGLSLVGGDQMSCGLEGREGGHGLWGCMIDPPIPAGSTQIIEATFRSVAKPQPFARAAEQSGLIDVDGARATYPVLFRATDGSIDDPRPYTPAPLPHLTVTAAGAVTLTRQGDGDFEGRLPVSIHNDGDASHSFVPLELALPAGLSDWPWVEPDGGCSADGALPAPPGGSSWQCGVNWPSLAEGQTLDVEYVLQAPADSDPGALGEALTEAALGKTSQTQTDGANRAAFTVTIAG
ncbi:hypothetical protein [Actinoplanes sp. NBRC 103695]|uniref:hypothetical protein n=1 Tax=Actinoplanes sp. NBRC 103695 TaxID=3032202 RepID=UPI0024A11AEE|nr:hypothetical protein [Actinoplanes sp. NBRC 103695]GLY98664.1 hypothetical protein Acsp02_59180 [Actinoplanes sp. NBRC 103695]